MSAIYIEPHRSRLIQIHPDDNVAVTSTELHTNEETVPPGHKIALRNIAAGEPVIKYGFPIGTATANIPTNAHVHTHNTHSNLGELLQYTYTPVPLRKREKKSRTFMGYERNDGRSSVVTAGIRNEIWIINTVGCVNGIAERIAVQSAPLVNAYSNIDGVYAFSHPLGCSQMSADQLNTQRVLGALVRNPNAGGVLVLGLGCENNHIEEFKKFIGPMSEEFSRRVKFLNTQDVEYEIEAGIRLVTELAEEMRGDKRTPIDASKLVLGLKCGGSDGFSGITGNPLAGRLADHITDYGGIAILTEVPEMFGAETILMNRCVSRGVFEDTVRLINDFKQYYINHGLEIDQNPSPGNKAGGITTLEDKSLGCTQKAGTSEVTAVIPYGGRAEYPGVNLLESPGNDIVAMTALAAAGAQITVFTTGRGTPVGSPVPVIKVATNTALAQKKKSWIDFDAGVLADGADMDTLSEEFFDYFISIAEGRKTQSELNGYRDFAIWKNGVTL